MNVSSDWLSPSQSHFLILIEMQWMVYESDYNSKRSKSRLISHHNRLSRAVHDGKRVMLLHSLSISAVSNTNALGPAFLPSEHDDLPPGLAFMVQFSSNSRHPRVNLIVVPF
jgi:hypothetical protein